MVLGSLNRLARALFGLSLSALAFSAAPGFCAMDPHIARIEGDLEPMMQVKGRPVHPTTLARSMAAHHTPAVSIAVVDHGKIVWAKAYGYADVSGLVRATTKTVFQAGSISKPIAASGAMQLVQAGQLDLDAPANSELKSWKIPANSFDASHPVTLRGLLTHTAGMTIHGFPGYAAGAPVPSVVQVLNGAPPANTAPVVVDVTPGTIWRYSGGGITIAQLMMTEATGDTFPALMQKGVLGPLGMTSSTYEQPLPASREDAATGYLKTGAPVAGRFHTYPEMAAAGLWTNPTDLATWLIALQGAYDGGSQTLMKQKTAKDMLTPGLGHWGLGISVEGDGDSLRFSHGGDDWGFKAQLVGYMTGGRGIVVMANGDGSMSVLVPLMQAVARAYGWKGLEPTVIVAGHLNPAEKKALVGTYGHDGFKVGIELHRGRLKLREQNGAPIELIATADGGLAGPDVGLQLNVERKDGAVVGIRAESELFPRIQ